MNIESKGFLVPMLVSFCRLYNPVRATGAINSHFTFASLSFPLSA